MLLVPSRRNARKSRNTDTDTDTEDSDVFNMALPPTQPIILDSSAKSRKKKDDLQTTNEVIELVDPGYLNKNIYAKARDLHEEIQKLKETKLAYESRIRQQKFYFVYCLYIKDVIRTSRNYYGVTQDLTDFLTDAYVSSFPEESEFVGGSKMMRKVHKGVYGTFDRSYGKDRKFFQDLRGKKYKKEYYGAQDEPKKQRLQYVLDNIRKDLQKRLTDMYAEFEFLRLQNLQFSLNFETFCNAIRAKNDHRIFQALHQTSVKLNQIYFDKLAGYLAGDNEKKLWQQIEKEINFSMCIPKPDEKTAKGGGIGGTKGVRLRRSHRRPLFEKSQQQTRRI